MKFPYGSHIILFACLALAPATLNAKGGARPTPTPTPAPSGPAAPALNSPANGSSLVQPIALSWSAVSNPNGPIGSYTWQVSNSSSFATIIASGFKNMDSD